MTVNVRCFHPTSAASGEVYNVVLNPQPKLQNVSGDRLESWKEIAAYFHRTERTVRRWEDQEGLPVHRLQHGKTGSVYAFRHELDGWRESRKQLLEVGPVELPRPERAGVWRRLLWTGVVCGMAALGLTVWLLRPPAPPRLHVPNPEARRAFDLANFGPNPGRTQIRAGVKYYQEANRLDPLFAQAWVGLATAHQALSWFGEAPAGEVMPQARMEAQTALTLSPSMGGAWRVLGNVSHFFEWNHTVAEDQYRKAIELSPKGYIPFSWFAEFLIDMRRFEEASVYAKRAQDLAPRVMELVVVAGNVYLYSGQPDLAIAEYDRALEIEPGHGLANHFLGRAYLVKKEGEKAIARLRKSNEILGEVPMSVGGLGYALGIASKRGESEALLAKLLHRREHGHYPAFPIAQIHVGLGNIEKALDWLDRAAEEHNLGYYLPSVEPMYDPIRSHPRFQALMRRINLPQPR